VLTLFDSTCIIVGIIVAAGIYRISPVVAGLAPNTGWLLALWLLGGLMSLMGALCYAELATAYPHQGGDYVYLTRAFGRKVGFLYAWSQLWVVRPGSTGAMAFAFATYANEIWPRAQGAEATIVLIGYAFFAVLALLLINILGIREGKWTQNLLTVAKVAGLLAVVLVGLAFTVSNESSTAVSSSLPTSSPSLFSLADFSMAKFSLADFGLAMVFVLFTYGGWSEMAFVSAEVQNPRRNILRALLLGTVAVTAIYLLINLAFLHALGLQGTRNPTPATDVLELAIGPWAGRAISAMICIAALSAINGQIITGARFYYAMGTEIRWFSWLGQWNAQRGQPLCALGLEGGIVLTLIVVLGLTSSGFEKMVTFTAPLFWFFLMLVGVSLYVLRHRDATVERPFRVPGYPITPFVFCCACGYLVYSTVIYAWTHQSWESMVSIAILLLGILLCFYRPLHRSKEV
jgi:amino acid transporter